MSYVNLSKLTFLVADGNSFYREMSRRILRGFGAGTVLEAANAAQVKSIMLTKPVDVLFCDAELERDNGFDVIHSIRLDKTHPLREIPMLISTGTTRASHINLARNAGANMVIKKPMAPITLYDRLAWISQHPRPFWESATYFGPDRRVRELAGYKGRNRRVSAISEDSIDQAFEVGSDAAA